MLLLNRVLVHFEDSKLLNDLSNSQFHVHGSLADFVDYIKQCLNLVDLIWRTFELLHVSLGLLVYGYEVLNGNIAEDFTKGVNPLLDLIFGIRNDL